MVFLFSITLFLSAGLLFLVQPIVTRMLLPSLGSTPAVWNTCMVFFQTLLLLGYCYSHLMPRLLGTRRHALIHLLFFGAMLIFLPLQFPQGWSTLPDRHPSLWVLTLLLLMIGGPFLMISTTGPLLQKWFAATNHPHAPDPYYLYAASNLGSMIALLSYPFLMEWTLTLNSQRQLWSWGFGILLGLLVLCAWAMWKSSLIDKPSEDESAIIDSPLTFRRRAYWVLLAFVPSSLMLGTTTFLTTDLGSIPLLWVAPLTLYLLSFVLVFARRSRISVVFLSRWMPLIILVLVLTMLAEATDPMPLLICLHLGSFFWIALICHRLLALDRPPTKYLTEFYLWMSLGGALGGFFNGLLAPVVFSSFLEYPLTLILACFVRFTALRYTKRTPKSSRWDIVWPGVVSLLLIGCIFLVRSMELTLIPLRLGLVFGIPAIVCYTFLNRPIRFALGIAVLLIAGSYYEGVFGKILLRKRSFFGIHRVTIDANGSYHLLIHGNTVHGQQSLDPSRKDEPLNYYHRGSPIGRLFNKITNPERFNKVGVIGLGAGALACYAETGQRWTFFEIDPAVVSIATDPNYFTFCQNCKAELNIVLGDARQTLQQSNEKFNLLVIDAFSSDAIPCHLLTQEALEIYLTHLTDDGFLAFHISNRYLNISEVLANLAQSQTPPLTCLLSGELYMYEDERKQGKSPSQWIILTPKRERLPWKKSSFWEELKGDPSKPVWTDDFHHVISILK